MNFLLFLTTLLGWLPLVVPVGILVAIFLVVRKLNQGNITPYGPIGQPPTQQPWNAPPSDPHQKYDRPPIHIHPPTNLGR